MTEPTRLRHPVVVGVDGSDDARRAVEYAVEKARRWRCGLRLVHAMHDPVPMSAMLPVLSGELLADVARRITTEAAAEVERLSDGEVPTEAVVRTGPTVATLLDAGEDARMIVLGHRDLNAIERIFIGHTTTGVAARSRCPVVSVSPGWQRQTGTGVVVAGIDGSSASREVLSAAFGAASARRAKLRVVHAWRMPTNYEDLLERVSVERQWRTRTQPIVSEILAGWREEYPDVEVEVSLRYERVVDALVHESRSAELLVVGRHGAGGWLAGFASVLLGSTAQAVLRHARCPVEVAPHHQDEHEQHEARSGAESAGLMLPTY